uniref:Intraflagellar transport protein 57 homolog n=1 Tax=Eutreptiella gymnastica TaxID=73025 RepID=A0A6T2CRA7_9EUGL
MEDIIEKLKILNYEADFCLPKTFRPLTRTYFSRAVHNPNEQFFYFTSLVAWLMEMAGHHFQAPGQFDDPNSSATAIIYELKNMEFSVKDIAPGKLRVGNGDAVLHVLNILLDKVLTHRGWAFKPPEYPADNYDEDVEGGDEATDDDIQDDVLSESEGDEEWYHAAVDAAEYDALGHDPSAVAIETSVHPDDWRMELERVTPMLKLSRRNESKDWRSHLDWIWSLLETIEKWFPEVKAQLDKITNDINKGIEKIQKRELILSQQFEIWVDHFRTQKKDHMAITENHRTSSEGVGTLTNELVQITEMLDSVKAEISGREEKMTDTSPLVKIKESMNKIKHEVKEMELRIGVLQHATLHHKLRQSNNSKPGVNAPKNPDEDGEGLGQNSGQQNMSSA